MSEKMFWILMGSMFAFLLAMILAIGFIAGWDTQIDVCY